MNIFDEMTYANDQAPRGFLLERLQGLAVKMLRAATEAMAIRNPASEPTLAEVAGGCLAFSGTNAPLSCAIGVATNGPATEEELEMVEWFFKSRKSPVRVVVSERTHAQLPAMLRSRGYASGSLMQNWWLPLEGEPKFLIPQGVRVVKVDLSQADEWVRTVAAGFEETQAAVDETKICSRMLDTFFCLGFADGAHPFLAQIEGQTVGGGVLHVTDEVASIRTGSVRLGHRQKGVQSALLATRLNAAMDAGCRFAFSSTEKPGQSSRNLAKFGFQTLSSSHTMSLLD